MRGAVTERVNAVEYVPELLTSRYLTKADPRVSPDLMQIPEAYHWRSRPYEYEWARQFAHEEAVVLDAGCGFGHQLKYHLAEVCRETHACDREPAILTFEHPPTKVIFACMDITRLDYSDEMFDRVFCISVLEHMETEEREAGLREFRRVLRPGGLLVLTVDVPAIAPGILVGAAMENGLFSPGPVEFREPPNAIDEPCRIFRAVFQVVE